VALAVQLQKDLHQPELLTPTGKAAQIPLPLPLVPPRTAERATGRLVIFAPDSLQINPEKTVGVRSISLAEAYDGVRPPPPYSPGGPRPVCDFAYNGDESVDVSLSAERRKPQVTVGQIIVVRVEDGVAKYDFTFHYNVLYSGVKSLRIDVPKSIADGLRVTTPGFHEKVEVETLSGTYSGTTEIAAGSLTLRTAAGSTTGSGTATIDSGAAAPAGVGKADAVVHEDDVTWSISGETELMGSGQCTLHWEKPIEKLGLGKPVPLPIPHLKPRDVDRVWGQIVLIKSETIDVQPSGEPKSIQPIDPQHDLKTPEPLAAKAFQFNDNDWTLELVATRYELEKTKRSSIERALVRMVVTPADIISVQALYRIRSAQQRIEVELPAGAAFDSQPLRINGRSEGLQNSGKDNHYFVPLVAANPDTPVVIELRYTLPGDGSLLVLPSFPDEPAVVKAFLGVYLPETRTLLGSRGPWTEEFRWWRGPWLQRQPLPNVDPTYLVRWARGEEVSSTGTADDFQTDGRLYLYSTLRPADGPAGSLETTVINGHLLKGLVFGITVLLGLLLLPARLPVRAVVVGAAVIGLVLAGVFLPTFSMQILNGVLVSAIFIVAVLWTVACAVRHRKCWMPAPVQAACGSGFGVDVPQPEPPVVELPTPPSSVEAPKPDSQEGGQSNA
jgi:hypothetical protein